MANMVIVKGRNRNALAQEILQQINRIGQDRVITVMLDETGRIANQGGLFSSARAYIYYKT